MSEMAIESADVTLAAALEFIDSFEEPELVLDFHPMLLAHGDCGALAGPEASEASEASADLSNLRTSSDSDDPPSRPSSSQQSAQVSRKRPKKSTALASKRLRERKKREMAALVEEAAELETRLVHLQHRATATATTETGSTSGSRLIGDAEFVARMAAAVRESVAAVSNRKNVTSWFDVAADESRERKRSEALNMELRRALEDQARLADSLRGLVRGHSAGRSIVEALDKFQQRYPDRSISSPFDDMIMVLKAQTDQQYRSISSVFHPLTAVSASSAMQTKRGANDQLLVEITSVTPVSCGLHDAIELTMSGVAAKESHGHKTFLDKRTHGDETEKRYVMETPSTGYLNGVVFMRNFPERDRFVAVWGGTAIPHCGEMKICEKGWMLVSETPTLSGPISHIQFCLQAFVAAQDDGSDTPAVSLATQLALNERCLRSQSDFQLIQRVILEEASKKARLAAVSN